MTKRDIRAEIKKRMKARKMSVPALARTLGLHQDTLYKYLAGKTEMTAGNLQRLLTQLGGRIIFE